MENQVNTEAEHIENVKQSEGKMKLSILPEAVLKVIIRDLDPDIEYICMELLKTQHIIEIRTAQLEYWIEKLQDKVTLEQVCEAAEYGNRKYSRCNWKLGSKWSMYVDACLRHMLAFLDNETYDKESQCHHLAHAIMNLGILHYYISHEIGENDLKLVDISTNVE